MESLYSAIPMELLGVITLVSIIFITIKENIDKKYDSWIRICAGIALIPGGMSGLIYNYNQRIAHWLFFLTIILFIPLWVIAILFRYKNRGK